MAAPTAVSFPRPARRARIGLPLVGVAVLALAAIGVGALVGGGSSPTSDSAIGAPAPTFTLDDVRSPGATVALAPGKPAVVNFFAAWCVPCREELPLLELAWRRSGGAVSFVGVDVNDSRRRAGELLDETGVTFPAGYDPDRAVATDYGLRGMPTTVFVDAAGRVADVAHGRLSASDLDRRLARLTGRPGVGTS